jgi:negative regulator of flagellin synthesis FlgM
LTIPRFASATFADRSPLDGSNAARKRNARGTDCRLPRLESAMNDIGQVSLTHGLGATNAAGRINEATAAYRASAQSEVAPSAPRWAEGRDRVELSEHARHLDAVRAMPDVRMAKVEAIKAAIANGTYESPEKLQSAIDGLLRDVGG